ncbi:MAG TPA: NAD(+) diphosphatase [Bdellovibrio sp.]|nr:NAD(+) diphosphatase [Bdellovibrio sp.]
MIQDIHPHLFSNKFVANPAIRENDYVFFFKGDKLLLKQNGNGLEIPRKKELNGLKPEGVFLFSLNEINCFLVWECLQPENNQFTFQEISFFRTIAQKEIAWTSIVAFHLMNWYTQNKYCGKCGNPTVLKDDERAITCPSCHTTIYPKISPAIIVAILCGDKILLARGVNFRGNFYSLVAGYADIGESLEDAVVREVKEEVGVDVKNIRYYKSQPWPFSGSMMIGYIAEADDTQPIRIDKKEISDAAWFTRDNLPNHPALISIAGEIIEKFKNNEL